MFLSPALPPAGLGRTEKSFWLHGPPGSSQARVEARSCSCVLIHSVSNSLGPHGITWETSGASCNYPANYMALWGNHGPGLRVGIKGRRGRLSTCK